MDEAQSPIDVVCLQVWSLLKLYNPNKTVWDQLEAIARQQNLGISDVKALMESLVPSSRLAKVKAVLMESRVPETKQDYCNAYRGYNERYRTFWARQHFHGSV